MREIKFRTWDSNLMDYNPVFVADGAMLLDINYCFEYERYGEEWMQYIGRTDKDGTEIYEADVVEDGSAKYVVEYEEETAQFILVWCDNDERFEEFPANTKNLKVIGNIHENPELLEDPS